MARVRTHTVIRDGKAYTRRQHARRMDGPSSRGMRLRPGRAWHNAKIASLSLKQRKRAKAALFAGAAVSEILAFTVLRGAGGILFVTGLGLALLGAGLKART